MKILTYLGFTLLSILIQLSVMDFIHEQMQQNLKHVDFNATSPKINFSDLFKDISQKPHALYYRMQTSKPLKVSNNLANIYSNSTLAQTTTEMPTTIFEVLYEENENFSTTESPIATEFTSTEFDNVTEINLFETKNQTSNSNSLAPTTALKKNCHCNLLHTICDINCCCDSDCTENERKIFLNCLDTTKDKNDAATYCNSHILYSGGRAQTNIIDNLFCVVKTNLPKMRNKSPVKKHSAPNQYFRWHNYMNTETSFRFIKKYYAFNDPVWLYKNGSFYYLDLPSPQVNNYCTGRKPIKFLNDENITCIVKIVDLEMFQIIKNLEEGHIISVTERTINSSVLDCSTLHCVNWMIIVCNANFCANYDKSLHDHLCTDNICTNLALKLDYIFYYNNAKIVNATVKLYIQNMPMSLSFMKQEISVKFYMANESIENVIELSGNPGYIHGLPVIVSFVESNHTVAFYNDTSYKSKYIIVPNHVNGICSLTNITKNYVLFGKNKRMKCRYNHIQNSVSQNKTDLCKSIQKNISKLLGINHKIVISPYGNPLGVSDKDWITLKGDHIEIEPIYGNYQNSKLYCYNFITTISTIFTFDDLIDDLKGQNRILTASYQATAKNITFNMDDISTVLTIDVNFLDETKPSVYEYAGSPYLNINLPKDFFFPFPSNDCNMSITNMYFMMIYCCIIIFVQIK